MTTDFVCMSFTLAWWRSTPYIDSFLAFSRKCISAAAGVIPLDRADGTKSTGRDTFSRDVFWPRPETRKPKKSKGERFTFIASKPQEPGLGDAFHRLPWVHPFWAGMVFREIERALILSTATASLLKTESENKRFKLHTNHCHAGRTAGRRHSRCLETQRPSEEIHYLPLAPNIHCLLFE